MSPWRWPSALTLGVVALGGLLAATPATAAAPTPGWTAGRDGCTGRAGRTRVGNTNPTWSSVSCVSSVFCAAAGYYTGSGSTDLPLLGVEIGRHVRRPGRRPPPTPFASGVAPELRFVRCGRRLRGRRVLPGSRRRVPFTGWSETLVTAPGGRPSMRRFRVTAATGGSFGSFLQTDRSARAPQALPRGRELRGNQWERRGVRPGRHRGETARLGRPGRARATRRLASAAAGLPGTACRARPPGRAWPPGHYEFTNSPFNTVPAFLLQQSAAGYVVGRGHAVALRRRRRARPLSVGPTSCLVRRLSCEAVGQVDAPASPMRRSACLSSSRTGAWTESVAPPCRPMPGRQRRPQRRVVHVRRHLRCR